MHTKFYSVSVKERDHVGDPGVDGRIILKQILEKLCVTVWSGFNWLSVQFLIFSCEKNLTTRHGRDEKFIQNFGRET
jgi:hypothetical protein